MAITRLSDIIEPEVFTQYIIQNSVESTRLRQSGILVPNSVMAEQLAAGAHSFTVPFWKDLANDEANVVNDDPASFATPSKIGTGKQAVRKSFLHKSWSAMNLASEIAGDSALERIQERVTAYWDRQTQRRLIASLKGILASNVANDSGDMRIDITAETGNASKFSAAAVIDACGTLGDQMDSVVAIGMHSDIYKVALKADLIQTIPDSKGGFFQTFRGLAIIVDDGLPVDTGKYTSVLFGAGAVGYGLAAPRQSEGTEVENLPNAGNGGGQQVLHSRVNLALHPAGFTWSDSTSPNAVAGESPTITELENAAHWTRIQERKAVQLAFLITK